MADFHQNGNIAQFHNLRTRPLDEVGNPWRAARHVEILIALIAEASLLAEAVTPLPRD